jgi:hypothetical protein
MKFKKEYVIIPAVLIGLIALGGLLSGTMFSPAKPDTVSAYYHTNVCIGYTHDGVYHPVECKTNMLTNKGIGQLGLFLNGSSVGDMNITWMAIANGSTGTTVIQPTDTALSGEYTPANSCGLLNASAKSVGQAQGAWNLTYTWTSTCANAIVNATGLYNSSVGGTGSPTYAGLVPLLFAEANFTSTTLQSNDQLNVTWGIYITGTQ